MKYAKSKNLTVYDVVTIASIIEHEAGVPNQRKQVASVIYNRLREGMTLGSDATDPLRRPQLHQAADPVAAGIELALQHARPRRAAAGADLQPRHRDDQRGGAPGQRRQPLLRHQPRLQDARLLQDRSRIRTGRAEVRSVEVHRIAAMPSLAVIGHPVAHSRSPDMQTAALAELGLAGEWTYGALDVAPEDFEATVAELAVAGEYAGRQRHRAAQGGGAGDGRRGERAAPARSAPPTR